MTSLPKNLCHGDVVDIGGSTIHDDVADRLVRSLSAIHGPNVKPTLPDELLYDDIGLPVWNQIIFTPEFYQTHDEMALFDVQSAHVVGSVKPGVTIVDLGAGDTRKVERLLVAFEAARVPAVYLALDISRNSLEHNIAYLVDKHPAASSCVKCIGLWGDFQDGKEYVQGIRSPRLFLSLGSVLCNDAWPEALKNLRSWAEAMRPDDSLLIGMDAHILPRDKDKIWAAYHSRDDLYRQFFLNGFGHANRLVGEEWFREEDWDFEARLEQEPTTRHRFFFRAKRDIKLPKLQRVIAKGEEVDWFDSHKYDEDSVRLMCSKAGLSVLDVWQTTNSEFRESCKRETSYDFVDHANTGQYFLKLKSDNDQKEDTDSAISGV